MGGSINRILIEKEERETYLKSTRAGTHGNPFRVWGSPQKWQYGLIQPDNTQHINRNVLLQVKCVHL